MFGFGLFRELAKAAFSSTTLACGKRWFEEARISMREIIETTTYFTDEDQQKMACAYYFL